MLKKWSLIVIFMLAITLPHSVYAHSTMTKSTPSQGETVQKAVDEIVLEFNTAIEPIAVIQVMKSSGETVPINIKVSGKVVRGTLATALTDGSYEVQWKVAGEDTHIIEGKYAFTVKASAATTTPTATPTTSPTSVPQVSPTTGLQTNPTVVPTTPPSEEMAKQAGPADNLILIIVIAIVAIGGIIFLLRLRKPKG